MITFLVIPIRCWRIIIIRNIYGEMKRKWTLWSTCFNEEKKNITNNMIKVMKYGARRREDLLNEERKAIILKKIDEDENESKENKINLRRLITRKTKEYKTLISANAH